MTQPASQADAGRMALLLALALAASACQQEPAQPAPPECTTDAQCDDGDPCNGVEGCGDDGTCLSGAPLACDDGDPCNGVELCSTAGCQPGAPLVCDDGDACNGAETCDPGEGCVSGAALSCDDGDACNGAEGCEPAVGCVGGPPLVCDDGDACDGLETCDPATGCEPGEALECDDGDACNGAESCDPQVGCVSGAPLQCDDDDACNGVETCDAQDGCVSSGPLHCDDADACNGEETCDAEAGCLAGTPPQCDDGDACNGVEGCEPALGCVPGEAPVCDDGDACNGVEGCEAALGCLPGEAPVCDDGDACNGVEGCEPALGCVPGEAPVCDNGDVCDGAETCDPQWGCQPGQALVCDDQNVCNGSETCDAQAGCQPGEAAACDDGDACNGVETCDATAGCQPGVVPTCDDGDVCNGLETCDSQSGCQPGAPLVCDDQDACTGLESCDPALGCVAGAALECDDGLACTGEETCDAQAGCVPGTPPPGCCDVDAQCDDANACNGVESCDPTAHACTLGQPLSCDDLAACNGLETCDPVDGCQDGAPLTCDDQDACNGVETCDDTAGCVAGAPLVCDDADACNGAETCDSAAGCLPGTSLVCDDGDACNGGETCHPANGCVPGAPLTCDDLDACTGTESCDPQTGCVAGPALECDDGDACNGAELCNPASGCVAAAPLACDDNDACNGLETCLADSGCAAGTPLSCDDGEACNGAEGCDPASGCAPGEAPQCDDGDVCNGAEGCDDALGCTPGEPLDCDDGDACNGAEACASGVGCQPGAPMVCEDGEVCTDDLCDFAVNPADGCYFPATTASPSPTLVGIPQDQFSLGPVSLAIEVTGPWLSKSITVNSQPYTEGTPLTQEGAYQVVGTTVSCGGVTVAHLASFTIDASPPVLVAKLSEQPNEAGWVNEPLTVTWEAYDNQTPIVLGSVSPPQTLSTPGTDQVVTGAAANALGLEATQTLVFDLDFKAPDVLITSPEPNLPGDDQYVTDETTLTVSGLFGDDALSGFAVGRVTSSKSSAIHTFDAPGPFEVSFELETGVNTVVASATDLAGNTRTASICVIVDADAPSVAIQYPNDGAKTVDAVVSVSGLIQDVVVGSITQEEITVVVNGVDAAVQDGQFLAQGVPLALGDNTITATATDGVGNTATHQIVVTRVPATGRHLVVVSGDGQSGPVFGPLNAPVVYELRDGAGAPVPDELVVVTVTDNDGTVSSPDAVQVSPTGRAVALETGEDGRVSGDWTLGGRAGAGLNRLTATAEGALASSSAHATGEAIGALNVHVHMGQNQVGSTGEPLPMPLTVIITDAGGNPVPNQPVTFEVVAGDSEIGGQAAQTVLSNGNGYADAVLTLGQDTGRSVHRVQASMPLPDDGSSGTELGAVFSATAWKAGPPELTRVRGQVVDEDEQPVAGVTVSIDGSTGPFHSVPTDPAGRFEIGGAPVGFVRLVVDGTTAPPSEGDATFPRMTFELHTVPGVVNDLDRPIYVLRLAEPKTVTGLEDVTLTVDELPGFELTILAGTAITWPEGYPEGQVSVTPVHFDQAPMAPNDGLQSRVLVTIQPPGVKFDPPAPLQLPNVDGFSPGEKVEMYSFDHDLEAFVGIGLGTVSQDATVIRSDPGVGVRKGGWHCGASPAGGGGSAGISASVSASDKTLNASGGPAQDTTWSWGVTCGDIFLTDAPSCDDQSSCQAQVSSVAGNVGRGKVQVTHTCTTTGESATDETLVSWCDKAPHHAKQSGFKPPAVSELANNFGVVLGCTPDGSLDDIKVVGKLRTACCQDCPGSDSLDGQLNLEGGGSLSLTCNKYLGQYPPVLPVVGVYAKGKAEIGVSASGGVAIDGCCTGGNCWCYQGAIGLSASASIGAEAVLIHKSIASASVDLKTGVDVHGKLSCTKLAWGACFQGISLSIEVAFANGWFTATAGPWWPVCPSVWGQGCMAMPKPEGAKDGPTCPAGSSSCGAGGDGGGGGDGDACDVPSCFEAPAFGPGHPGSVPQSCIDAAKQCESDTECDDGNPCNGQETCQPYFGCVPGAPLECEDEDGHSCTVPTCQEWGDDKGCREDPTHSKCPSGAACATAICDPAAAGTPSGCMLYPHDDYCVQPKECGLTEVCDATQGCKAGEYKFCPDDQTCNLLTECEPLLP